MIPFPQISPEIFTIQLFGMELALRWYALAYLVGLLIGWWIVTALMRRPALWGDAPPMRPQQVEELLTWIILGVVLGGPSIYHGEMRYRPSLGEGAVARGEDVRRAMRLVRRGVLVWLLLLVIGSLLNA